MTKMAKMIINKAAYKMEAENDDAEITMYGQIVEQRPRNMWTGEEVEGSFIVESEFMDDLKHLEGCKNITIRMNSCGGDAGVSILIHNRLRELARNGAALTCIVDGVAMSGGSLIMCACDNVKVNPSSIVMIHKCGTLLFGYYNADELRSTAESNDAYDNAQVSIYTRKTGLSETVLKHMMSETTYMTGKEAVEKGFGNEFLENAEKLDISASADGQTIFVKECALRLPAGCFAPDMIPTKVNTSGAGVGIDVTNAGATPKSNEGGTTVMAKTIDELRNEYPELTAALADESAKKAAADERQRLAEIDAIAAGFDAATVAAAKYGEKPLSAKDMAYIAVQEAAKKGQAFTQNFMGALMEENHTSGAGNVGAAQVTPIPTAGGEETELTPEAKAKAAKKVVTDILHKKEADE